MSKTVENAHKVLEYALTQAAINGKVKAYQLDIDYADITGDVGATEYKNVKLRLVIDLSWVGNNEDDEIYNERGELV